MAKVRFTITFEVTVKDRAEFEAGFDEKLTRATLPGSSRLVWVEDQSKRPGILDSLRRRSD